VEHIRITKKLRNIVISRKSCSNLRVSDQKIVDNFDLITVCSKIFTVHFLRFLWYLSIKVYTFCSQNLFGTQNYPQTYQQHFDQESATIQV
jgi:hypothetical protein